MPTIYVALDQLVETCRALRDTPELRFAFLADLLPVDYLPREPRFEIVYLMASLGTAGFGDTPKRLRVKVRVPGNEPDGSVGFKRVAGGRMVRARGLRSVRHPFHRSSGSATDPDAGRLGGVSACVRITRFRSSMPVKTVRAAAGLAGTIRRKYRGNERSRAERLMDARDRSGAMPQSFRRCSTTTIALHRRMRDAVQDTLIEAATAIRAALDAGGKLLVFGNGGSAADAQHMTAELVGRFELRPGRTGGDCADGRRQHRHQRGQRLYVRLGVCTAGRGAWESRRRGASGFRRADVGKRAAPASKRPMPAG